MQIELRNVSKTYDERPLLDGLNFALPSGFVALVGPSGSGKTTLARLLVGEEEPDDGEVLIDGRHPKEWGNSLFGKLTYLSVGMPVFGSLSVEGNLSLFESKAAERERLLSLLGLFALKDRKASLLSKGEQARLAVLLAVAGPGSVLLLDEPTANLDDASSEKVFALLREESRKRTVFLLTHDRERALSYADDVYVLEKGKLTPLKKASAEPSCLPLEKRNGASRPYFELGFRATLRKKGAFLSTVALLSLTIACAFSLASLSFSDPKATLASGLADERWPIRTYSLQAEGQTSALSYIEASEELAVPLLQAPVGDSHCLFMARSDADLFGLEVDDSRVAEAMEGRLDELYLGFNAHPYEPCFLPKSGLPAFEKALKARLEIGSLLPVGPHGDEALSLPFSNRYVVAGYYDVPWMDESAPAFLPPIVIPDEAFASDFERGGVSDAGAFKNGLSSLFEDISAFYSSRGETIVEPSSTLFSADRFLIGPESLPLPFVNSVEGVDPDQPIAFYHGRLPERSGEVLLPYDAFSRMLYEGEDTYLSSYFEEKEGTFTVDLLPFAGAKMKVVGAYDLLGAALKDENGDYLIDVYGTPQRPSLNPYFVPILLSDEDWSSANSIFFGEKRFSLDPALFSYPLLGTSLFGLEHLDDIDEGKLSQAGNGVSVLSPGYYRDYIVLFATPVLALFMAVSFLVGCIYLSRNAKECAEERSSLLKMGARKRLGLVPLSSALLNVVASLALSLPFDAAFALGLSYGILAHTPSFPLPFVLSIGYGLLAALATSLVSLLLFYAASTRHGRKKDVGNL